MFLRHSSVPCERYRYHHTRRTTEVPKDSLGSLIQSRYRESSDNNYSNNKILPRKRVLLFLLLIFIFFSSISFFIFNKLASTLLKHFITVNYPQGNNFSTHFFVRNTGLEVIIFFMESQRSTVAKRLPP